MSTITVNGYWQKNLGDDLFLKILAERYPNTLFTVWMTTENSRVFNDLKNLRIFKDNRNIYTRVRDSLLYRLMKIPDLKTLKAGKSDMIIEIGGSIFMLEKKLDWSEQRDIMRRKYLSNRVNNYFVIGSNFGPYYYSEQLLFYNNFFSSINSVCFRDSVSKKLFLDLENVSFAPDVIFNLDEASVSTKELNKNYIVISIINLEDRQTEYEGNRLNELTEKYEEKIAQICNFYISKNIEIKLFSFCDFEGDRKSIERIYKILNDTDNVEKVSHSNISESLSVLKNASRIIACRFHAMILGWLFGVPTLVISYSKKTESVINDLFPEQNCFGLKDVDKISMDDIEKLYSKMSDKVLIDIKRESVKQFSNLDRVLLEGR